MAKLTYKSGLPQLIATKIYKTGQTRGASVDEIYQNRVGRNSTVLIPLSAWNSDWNSENFRFESGYIVIARPDEYFSEQPPAPNILIPSELILGQNLLIYYRTRTEWNKFNPQTFGWKYAQSRTPPLQGQYIARVADTTSNRDSQIFDGFRERQQGGVGAGIRVYEYASSQTLEMTRYQLAYLVWHTIGIEEASMQDSGEPAARYKEHVEQYCIAHNLNDMKRLEELSLIHI